MSTGMQRLSAAVAAVAVVALGVAARAAGTVTCRTACRKCSTGGERSALQDLYCGMCHECRARRRDWMRRAALPSADEFSYEDFDECPTAAPCDSDEEVGTDDDAAAPQMLKSGVPITTPTTTTTTTTTTTKKQCPEVKGCKPRKRRPQPCCVPMCPYPTHPFCPTENAPQRMAATVTASQSTTKDYFYVHIGVPKPLLNNLQTA